MDTDQVRHALSDHIVVDLAVARNAVVKMRPGGTLVFMGGTGGRRVAGLGTVPAATAAMPAFVATLALEIAPVHANLIAAGFVDTPLSATLLGDKLEARRQELRDTLPIGRVVGTAGSPVRVPAAGPGSAGLAADQMVGEQQDGCPADGGEPGGDVEEAIQSVDVEDFGGGPATAEGAGDAGQAREDQALLPFAGDDHVGEQPCG
jgi:NAD(P)-dependent dehydrogenase (short-subunit alcohol dehydrogenase family)